MEHWILELLKTPRGRLGVGIAASLLGGVFVYIAWPAVQDARRLRYASETTTATVVETRISRGQHLEKNHQVRYRFRAPGHDESFTYCELGTGRSDLWSTVSEDEWTRAREAGVIHVAYVADDPRINCPADQERKSAGDAMAGLIIGLVAAVAGAGLISASILRAALPASDPLAAGSRGQHLWRPPSRSPAFPTGPAACQRGNNPGNR